MPEIKDHVGSPMYNRRSILAMAVFQLINTCFSENLHYIEQLICSYMMVKWIKNVTNLRITYWVELQQVC